MPQRVEDVLFLVAIGKMCFVHVIPFSWSLGNHENFALQIADATNFYITEKVWLCVFDWRQEHPQKNGPRVHANLHSYV